MDYLKDPTSPAREFLSYGLDEPGDPEVAGRKCGWLELSSIREFEIGNRTLLVVHLASGQDFTPVRGELVRQEYVPDDVLFDSLTNTVFVEPLRVHARGFDFWVVLP